MAKTNRRILLATIPQGRLEQSHVRLDEAPVPTPGEGEVLVRALYVSLDAANRAWMQGATYRSALNAGEVMLPASAFGQRCGGVASRLHLRRRRPRFRRHRLAGALPFSRPSDWTKQLVRIEPLTALTSGAVFGITGLTAYSHWPA